MPLSDDLIEMIREMSEKEAKTLLAEVFLELESIGYGGKTKQQAYDNIYEIYRGQIVGKMIFGNKPETKDIG